MTEEARQARNAYYREYAKKNREKVREYQKKWHRKHPEKSKEYAERYWERKAAEQLAGGGHCPESEKMPISGDCPAGGV